MKKITCLFLLVVTLGIFGYPLSISAQQRLEVQGLSITPFLIETEIFAGKSSKHSVTLSNTTNSDLPITVSINDFVPNESGDAPKFLPTDNQSASRFSLSRWVSIIRQPNFTIPAGGETQIEFNITPPEDAEPGTHYGGLLFSFKTSPLKGTNTEVEHKAAVIILAQLGKAKNNLTVTRFIAEPTIDYSKVNFFLSLYNQGNVHEKPKGEVRITNWFGKQVGSGQINSDASIVLPQSQRNFSTSWNSGWSLGRYTATAVIYYGSPKLELRAVEHFWIVPWQRLFVVIALLIGLIILGYSGLKRYNKWVIKRNNKLKSGSNE